MSREKIKVATDKAAKSIMDLVRVIEQNGGDLSDADVEKVFAYLNTTLATTAGKARLARDVARFSGGFDFSKDFGAAPTAAPKPVHRTPSPPVAADDDDDGIVFLDDED